MKQALPALPALQGKLPADPENPLNQLPPLAIPDTIGLWPPAPGWWLAALALLAGTAYTLLRLYRHHQSELPKRQATRELEQLWQQFLLSGDTQHYLHHCNNLLRRYCKQQFPDAGFSSLTGSDWLHALDNIVGKSLLNSAAGQQLLAIYQQAPAIDINTLHPAVCEWFASVNYQSSFASRNHTGDLAND